jgi:hypothetical protein
VTRSIGAFDPYTLPKIFKLLPCEVPAEAFDTIFHVLEFVVFVGAALLHEPPMVTAPGWPPPSPKQHFAGIAVPGPLDRDQGAHLQRFVGVNQGCQEQIVRRRRRWPPEWDNVGYDSPPWVARRARAVRRYAIWGLVIANLPWVCVGKSSRPGGRTLGRGAECAWLVRASSEAEKPPWLKA